MKRPFWAFFKRLFSKAQKQPQKIDLTSEKKIFSRHFFCLKRFLGYRNALELCAVPCYGTVAAKIVTPEHPRGPNDQKKLKS